MEIKITLTKEQVAQVLNENKQNSHYEPETYSIIGAAKKLDIGKTKIHKLINEGEILKIMIGKSPRIHKSEIEKFAVTINDNHRKKAI
jgi:excisionase family DNA binding protein